MSTWEERFPKLWAFGERVAVVVIGTLLFYLFSALIVTIPAALVGLFAAIALLIRPVNGETIGRFWRGLRRSFGRALILGLLDVIVGFSAWFYFMLFWSSGLTATRIVALVFASVGMFAAMVNVYAWPLLAWYPQPLVKLLKRAALLAAAHPFQALGGLVGCAMLVVLMLFLPGSAKSLVVIMGPGLAALITGYAAWHAMKRYAGPDDDFAE
jgi:uncharacterized membrane protein YesL